MENIVLIVHLILALCLIAVVLLQRSEGGGLGMGGGGAVSASIWTHIAITYDAGTDTKTLWIDGAISATDNVPQSGPTQYAVNGTIESENLHIGSGQDDGNNFFFSGNIDDVTIWDNVLSGAEINNIKDNSIPEPSVFGLIGLTGLGLILRRRR